MQLSLLQERKVRTNPLISARHMGHLDTLGAQLLQVALVGEKQIR